MERQTYPYKTVESINILFYQTLMNPSPVQYSTLHSLAFSLLQVLPDKNSEFGNKNFDKAPDLKRLEEISINAFQGYDLTTLEYISFREMRFGSKLNTPFNVGFRKKVITLGEILRELNKIRAELVQMFIKTLIINELDTSLIMPLAEGSGKREKGRGL